MPWVLGYGSLLHPDSLRRTLPHVKKGGIRPVRVGGTRRIFNLVSPGWAKLAGGVRGRRVAALNAVPATEARMNAVAFFLEEEEIGPLDRREFCYEKIKNVPFADWGKLPVECSAEPENGLYYSVMDAAKLKARFPQRYRDEYQPLGADGLLSDDVLPQEDYLSVCLQGARLWGDDFLTFFLRHTLLADGRTTLDHYLQGEALERHLQADVAAILTRRG